MTMFAVFSLCRVFWYVCAQQLFGFYRIPPSATGEARGPGILPGDVNVDERFLVWQAPKGAGLEVLPW